MAVSYTHLAAFVGVTPKVVVREGEHVNAGDALFVNKSCPEVKFASPVSGEVTAIERGEQMCIRDRSQDGWQQMLYMGSSCILFARDGVGAFYLDVGVRVGDGCESVSYTHLSN